VPPLDRVDGHETDIVAVACILGARIAEPCENQHGYISTSQTALSCTASERASQLFTTDNRLFPIWRECRL
jgi:hypothetical protein